MVCLMACLQEAMTMSFGSRLAAGLTLAPRKPQAIWNLEVVSPSFIVHRVATP